MPRIAVRLCYSSLLFTPSGQFVQVKSGPILSGSDDFTISAWIKPATHIQPSGGGAIYSERKLLSGNDRLSFFFFGKFS